MRVVVEQNRVTGEWEIWLIIHEMGYKLESAFEDTKEGYDEAENYAENLQMDLEEWAFGDRYE